MDCTLCPNKGPGEGYTVIRGRDVCLDCVDLIIRLFPGRVPEHEHEWGWWHSVTATDVVRGCMVDGCDETQETEGGICAGCGVFCVELQTDYAHNHTTLVPHGDWDNYDPCEDENGLPAAHGPLVRRK